MTTITEYSGASGLNYFTQDPLVRAIVEARFPAKERKAALDRLTRFGALCGGKLAELVDAAHQDGKYPTLRKFDRWGRRVDEIVYCTEQVEARRLAHSHAELLPPGSLLERMTMAYLLNQNGEGGITCPLAMTDGLVQLLESHGTPEQKKRWLPLLHDASVPTPLTGGQMVTERQGGSNVSENETRAVPQKDGSWRLTGLKWFCSNPGELWVTTAKPEGSDMVGLFVIPRRMPDESLNEAHLLRLKDLSGTRGKATAEIEYRGAYAELVGRASQGMALLLGTVLQASRIHVAAASLGMMRRAAVEARLYAKARIVAGRPAAALPPIAESLSKIEALLVPATLAFYEELALIDRGDAAAEILVPLLKIQVSEAATRAVREARLVFAGNGTLRDFSILPRLTEETLIQEIWEGTGPILAAHVLKGLRRPASGAAFFSILSSGESAAGAKKSPAALGALREIKKRLEARAAALRADPKAEVPDSLELCADAYRALSLALLLREAGGPIDAEKSLVRIAERFHRPCAF